MYLNRTAIYLSQTDSIMIDGVLCMQMICTQNLDDAGNVSSLPNLFTVAVKE